MGVMMGIVSGALLVYDMSVREGLSSVSIRGAWLMEAFGVGYGIVTIVGVQTI